MQDDEKRPKKIQSNLIRIKQKTTNRRHQKVGKELGQRN